MDDELPKRTSATRPRERLRAGWNVRINVVRARVHVMSIEGVAGMHGSLPGLATGRLGVIMFFSAYRLVLPLPSLRKTRRYMHPEIKSLPVGYVRVS